MDTGPFGWIKPLREYEVFRSNKPSVVLEADKTTQIFTVIQHKDYHRNFHLKFDKLNSLKNYHVYRILIVLAGLVCGNFLTRATFCLLRWSSIAIHSLPSERRRNDFAHAAHRSVWAPITAAHYTLGTTFLLILSFKWKCNSLNANASKASARCFAMHTDCGSELKCKYRVW